MFFHLDVAEVGGGFVGVDVFFVISGYLITRIVRAEAETGRVDLLRFYGRRIRRLFPALLVTVAATLLAGFLMLTPAAYARMGQSSLASLFSLANFNFWAESGYFDEAAGLKPLLHMWSLSVEEQFYLVWPGLLALLARVRRKGVYPATIGVCAALSLLWAEWVLPDAPNLAFFMMPARICEFAVGALLVSLPTRAPSVSAGWDVALAIALGGLLWVGVFFDPGMSFPGVSSLLPCAATALAIGVGNTPRVGRLLIHPTLRWVGRISYSLYLVHWPLIVFYKQAQLGGLSWLDRIILLVLSFGGAALLHYKIETRHRLPRQSDSTRSGKRFIVGASACTVLLAVGSLAVAQSEGIPSRYPKAYRELLLEGDRVTREDVLTWNLGRCYLGGTYGKKHNFRTFKKRSCLALDPKRKNILVFGDSTAAHLIHGLTSVHAGEVNFLQATVAGCRGDWAIQRNANCAEMNRYITGKWLPRHADEIDSVILAARWTRQSHVRWARKQVRKIKKAGISSVALVGPPVNFNTAAATVIGARNGSATFFYDRVFGSGAAPAARLPLRSLEAFVPNLDRRLQAVATKEGVSFLSPLQKQCDEQGCVVSTIGPGGHASFIQRDRVHFTPSGSIWSASRYSVAELMGHSPP